MSDDKRSAHAPVTPADLPDLNQYLLSAPAEVLYTLRTVKNAGDLLTVHFNQGEDFFLTALVEVGEDALLLDAGADEPTNQRAERAGRFVCVTAHDKVKIQFALDRLVRVEHDGRPAFRAALPASVLRLQRREYYRLATPVVNPLKVDITLAREDGTRQAFSAQVADLSAGGLAVVIPPAGMTFEVDQQFDDCVLDLPDIGTIRAGLRVRNCYEVQLRNGQRMRRCGCEFTRLSAAMQTLIERYILKVERARKARETGLGSR